MTRIGVSAPERMVTVFVHEYATGGGLAGAPVPASWEAEGGAMRRAIATDLAALPGVRVVMTLDPRAADEPGPWEVVRVGPGREEAVVGERAAVHDFTLIVAPETGGLLAERARWVARAGGRSLGSTPEAIALTADKLRLADHWRSRGLPTPPCRRVVPADGLPRDVPYPAVLKPIDGAGSLDTFLIEHPDACPPAARHAHETLLQPWMPGVPMSAAFLVTGDGRARLVGIGRQTMEIRAGRILYRGGRVPEPMEPAHELLHRAIAAVPGLRGWIGVDFLWQHGLNQATLLEINPRLTTSYLGYRRLFPAGLLAARWLTAVGAPRARPEPAWPAPTGPHRSVSFHNDGSLAGGRDGP